MATTIKSTALDFNAIKNNLKTFLAAKEEFADYNFEASGLSNILDVLAYNTHFNALTANFALNESFLSTAQLRSSIVSLAEGLGYAPKSKTASRATVNLSINTGVLAGRPATITLPAGTKFNATVDDTVYTFQTREAVVATDDGNGYYEFLTLDGSSEITIYEGISKTKTFYVGSDALTTTYVIPDTNLDINTCIVKVFEGAADTSYTTYTNIIKATTISDSTTLYVLKEAPNEYYELTFGDGNVLGRAPSAGNKVVVEYLSVAGVDANEAQLFRAANKIQVTATNSFTLNATTVTDSLGGAEKEGVESIRKNAPFQYAAQNRMVTAVDYSSMVLRNFSELITDIKAWGGEDALKPEYGTVFMSIVFNDNVTDTTIASVKKQVLDLSKQLSVISFDLKFDDPVKTYVESNVYFQFNPKLTTLSLNTIRDQVNTAISNYFSNSTGKFEQSFRRSNLLTLVDEVDPSVLSSRADIKMQQRFVPLVDNVNDVNLRFPANIAVPDDVNYIITTSAFVYKGQICIARNRLNSNVLEVVSLGDLSILIDNIGEYDPANGTVSLVGFSLSEIIGGGNYIKLSAVPANQSAISPIRNDVLDFDPDVSFASGVVVSST
jgi:hypothetical protein